MYEIKDLILIIPGIHVVQYPAVGVVNVGSLVASLLCIVDGWQGDRI